MTSWLVTGGTGLIGRHLIHSLSSNDSVAVLTRQSKISLAREVKIITADLSFQTIPALPQVDRVVHCATLHHAQKLTTKEIQLLHDTNVNGLKRLLESLASAPPRRFYLMSSVKVSELESTLNCDGVEWIFSKTKQQSEQISIDWALKNGVELVILRPAPVYGPEVKENLGKFFHGVSSGKFLFVGSGQQKKSMVFIENLVAAIRFLDTVPIDRINGPVTVSDYNHYSLRQVADWIADVAAVPRPKCLGSDSLARLVANCVLKVRAFSPLPRSLLSLNAWLTESIHEPTLLKYLGFTPPFDTNEAINLTVKSTQRGAHA